MRSYGELLKEGIDFLEEAGVEEARADAERLLMDLREVSRSFLFLYRSETVPEEIETKFREGLRRRAAGEPVQYVTGMQEFMGLPFRVCPDVLIPRLDTEVLVEKALEIASEDNKCRNLLDMCCGSGAIAVSMAYSLRDVTVTACDISSAALRITAENAALNGVSDRVRLLRTDMFSVAGTNEGDHPAEALSEAAFDMILSNPPYIASGVIPELSEEVRNHEPLLALDGGRDGLRFYRILAEEAGRYLRPGGTLLMEIGYDQESSVRGLLEEAGVYRDIRSQRDLAGVNRIVYCRRK